MHDFTASGNVILEEEKKKGKKKEKEKKDGGRQDVNTVSAFSNR